MNSSHSSSPQHRNYSKHAESYYNKKLGFERKVEETEGRIPKSWSQAFFALIGLALGDSLGAPLEMKKEFEIRSMYVLVKSNFAWIWRELLKMSLNIFWYESFEIKLCDFEFDFNFAFFILNWFYFILKMYFWYELFQIKFYDFKFDFNFVFSFWSELIWFWFYFICGFLGGHPEKNILQAWCLRDFFGQMTHKWVYRWLIVFWQWAIGIRHTSKNCGTISLNTCSFNGKANSWKV